LFDAAAVNCQTNLVTVSKLDTLLNSDGDKEQCILLCIPQHQCSICTAHPFHQFQSTSISI
jgi:hypothetical protein